MNRNLRLDLYQELGPELKPDLKPDLTQAALPTAHEAVHVRARARVKVMPEYHPPLGDRNGLRLDFNENTVACSPAVLAAIQGLTAAELTRYPERGPVEAMLAKGLKLRPGATRSH